MVQARAFGIRIILISLLLAVLFLLFHFFAFREADSRKISLRQSNSIEPDTSNSALGCKSTSQGKVWIADDHGFVCTRHQWNHTSRCCDQKETSRFTCKTCNSNYQCCKEYEYCVSCCLRIDASKSVKTSRIFSSVTLDDFDFCAAQCRTYSGSVIHQNSYRSVFRYCYGDKESPLLKDLEVE